MTTFKKENIKRGNLTRKSVHVPEFEECIEDGIVYVHQISMKEKSKIDAFSMEHSSYKEKRGQIFIRHADHDLIGANIVIACTYDKDGNKIFNEDDMDIIRSLSARSVERLVKAYRELNEPSQDEIEEAVKN